MTNKLNGCGIKSADVSVIIPAWNAALTLQAAVQSALTQTNPPIEVLVCDDGSTDSSRQVVAQFADHRIVWLPGTHSGGPGGPRNRGIAASKGEWIAILDSDDEWLPEKLAKQKEAAARLGCIAASTNAYSIKPIAADHPLFLSWSSPEITFNDLLHDNPVVCSSALFHRSLLEKVGGFSEKPALRSVADYTLWLRISTFTNFAYVAEPLVRYWNNPGASLRSQDEDPWAQKKSIFDDFVVWAEHTSEPGYLEYVRKIQKATNRLPLQRRRAILRHWARTTVRRWLR